MFDQGMAIQRVEDVPVPIVVEENRIKESRTCPKCGKDAKQRRILKRKLWDVGDIWQGQPRRIHLNTAQYQCRACGKYFSEDTRDLAEPFSIYTRRVMQLALWTVIEDGLPYREASWRMWRDHRVFVPFATIQNWVEAGGKKSKPENTRRVSGLGVKRLQRIHRGR